MVMSRVARALFPPLNAPAAWSGAPDWKEDPIGLYRLLRAYYDSTGLYDAIATMAVQTGTPVPARRPLRNPAHRVVEFYVTHLWPDPLAVETDNERIVEPIEQVWQWSNWEARRRLAARQFALYGDLFIKVVSVPPAEGGRVYFQVLDTETVIDFDEDERGFLSYLLIEVDRMVRDGDVVRPVYHTEIWSRDTGLRIWERDRRMKVEELGPPTETRPLADFGIDFIPVVHAKFQDTGWKRGASAFTHALEKIDEANTQATRLHQLLFRHNNVNWALGAGGNDPAGRPLPAVRIDETLRAAGAPDNGLVELGGEQFISLPGNARLEALVPTLNYEAALAVLNAQLDEIERDLPEMAFHRIREQGEISGRAARMMMTDAIDKIIEARGNALQALARADAMALTMGAKVGIGGFGGAGTYDAGDFDHTFAHEDPIGISELEQAETDEAEARADIARHEAGWSRAEILRRRGFSDEEIAKMETEREAEAAGAAERMMDEFARGGPPPADAE